MKEMFVCIDWDSVIDLVYVYQKLRVARFDDKTPIPFIEDLN